MTLHGYCTTSTLLDATVARSQVPSNFIALLKTSVCRALYAWPQVRQLPRSFAVQLARRRGLHCSLIRHLHTSITYDMVCAIQRACAPQAGQGTSRGDRLQFQVSAAANREAHLIPSVLIRRTCLEQLLLLLECAVPNITVVLCLGLGRAAALGDRVQRQLVAWIRAQRARSGWKISGGVRGDVLTEVGWNSRGVSATAVATSVPSDPAGSRPVHSFVDMVQKHTLQNLMAPASSMHEGSQ